jgi:hypothetical protein
MDMNEAAKARGLVEQTVTEAIDAVAAPARRVAVLKLALTWARREAVPERGPEVAEFVEGPLFRAAQELLGHELAEAIRLELAPIVRMTASQEISEVRPSTPVEGYAPLPPDEPEDDFPELTVEAAPEEPFEAPRRQAAVTDPAPGSLPLLLVASVDPSTLQQLGRALAGVASLEPARDALAILENLGEGDVVVVDCHRPSVRLETLLALSPELPGEARVVLWREAADLEAQLAAFGSGLPRDWIRCGEDADADDVAAVCRVLFE